MYISSKSVSQQVLFANIKMRNELSCALTLVGYIIIAYTTVIINIVFLIDYSKSKNHNIFNATVTNHYQANKDHYSVSASYINDDEKDNVNCLLYKENSYNLIRNDLIEIEKMYPIDEQILVKLDSNNYCEIYTKNNTSNDSISVHNIKYIRLFFIILIALDSMYAYYKSSIKEKIKNDSEYIKKITKELYELRNTKYGDDVKNDAKNDADSETNGINDV